MIIQHLRKKSTHEPYATLVAYKTDNGVVRFGYSKYAKKLEEQSFSKKDGVDIAIDNATRDIVLFKNDTRSSVDRKNAPYAQFLIIPISIERAAMLFLQRAVKYFKEVPANVTIYFNVEKYKSTASYWDFKTETVNFLTSAI